jgi:hypothetical protein
VRLARSVQPAQAFGAKAGLKATIPGARFRQVRRFSPQVRMLGLFLILARSWKGGAVKSDDDRFSHAR